MRVKLGNRVYLCTTATHNEGSVLIMLTIGNQVYTVNMLSAKKALECHENLLIDGYYDFSNYEYCC